MGEDEDELRRIAKVLQGHGYWYPPDALRAVREGRDTYHPLDPKDTYPVRDVQRQIIQAAIGEAERGAEPEYFIALNHAAAEELELKMQESTAKTRKRGRK